MRPSRLSKCFAVFSHEPQNSTDQKVRSTHSSPPQEFSTTPMQYAECLADLDFGCGATTLSDHALRVTISTVRAHATPFFPALVPVATVSHAVPQVKLPTATLDHSLHTTRTVPGGTVHTPQTTGRFQPPLCYVVHGLGGCMCACEQLLHLQLW